MPLISICVGLTAGLVVWVGLDQIQSRQVQKIFGQELESQLGSRARESLVRFDRYLENFTATTRLLANYQRLSEYLEPLFWSRDETFKPVVYKDFRPYWLPDFFAQDALRAPSHVMLTDPAGRVREVFQADAREVPDPLRIQVPSDLLDAHNVISTIRSLGGSLYLIVSDAIADAGGYDMGYLVVLVPVDDAFLAASQRGVDVDRAAVALVDPGDQRIVASVDTSALTPGSLVQDWLPEYVVTSRPLSDSSTVDSDLQFATFVSHAVVDRMSRHVGLFERRQRGIAAAVFILVFTAVIYLVSSRLNKVLLRMTRFSQRALGIADPGFRPSGNQLVLLEEWIQHFTQLVLRAREEMNLRHQAEMRESEALKAAMMEASLDAIVTLDHGGRIIECNPAARTLLGMERDTAIGAVFCEQFLPEDSQVRFRRLLDRSQEPLSEPLGRGELVACHRDGQRIPVEISIVPIDLEAERFHTLYIHDISTRKEAEKEIKGLARFVSESPNPILRVMPDGLIVYANSASRPLLMAWQADAGEEMPAEWCQVVVEVLTGGEPQERELEVFGQVYALLFVPIVDLGYINIYVRDITAVRRAEQESRQHQAELVHVCRLSTMGEVATGMAHELNQPLSAIVNYANGCTRRLQNGVGETGALIGALHQITVQAQRASEIIRRLRALVGKQPPIRSHLDLNHLVREVCNFVEFETQRLNLQIEQELNEAPIPVCVDLVQIEQVLLNLVRNALDALEDCAPERRRLRIRTGIEGDQARIAVIDTGPGIEPERLGTLFDAFVTTKETGMGMGLAISLTIMENHDGRLWAESQPGQGATFHLALPLAPAPEEPTENAEEATENEH